MYRFAEMLRRGGELDGVRILSPAMVARAHRCWTGDKPNQLYRKIYEGRGWEVLPAYIGLGFTLRGDVSGAGPGVDGQILVLYDVLDITPGRKPRFVQNFQQGHDNPLAALQAYVEAVKSGAYPAAEHCF